ncbi:putative ATP-dependent endonuclease of the OLD family [Flavobacterium gillisiae]|uniref:Putative ATP-dependent endonuclease of the OLD family n=1 Tax=Flavobacterium gillisiae TaxID=150146 RepID=A0A1H4FCE4_9FLAO|nr:AAA family ATPase [Flavobacterium gillisiae]SEA94955.1 putative ATP-dependent endonuclease of the OLD family [Flavobacterium gillisiae]
MYLQNIKLWNFRRFGSDVEFDIENPNLNLNFTKGLNVIIGENDSGKTAIIDAIKLALKTHSYDYIRVEDKDFFSNSNRFRIELLFNGLIPDEAKNFTEWLGWNGIGENAEPYLKINYDVKRQGEKILPTDLKAGADEDGYQLTAEAREYLKATYLKPLRDAENELIAKRNSRLSQILLGDSAFKGKENDHELVIIFENLSKEIDKYFKGQFEVSTNNNEGEEVLFLPQEGKIIKNKIDGYIKDFYSNEYETEFIASSNDIKSILEKLTLFLKDELNPGLGTLNRLFMAAELLHLNKSNWSGLRLGLVEELEAHLHPQAQMQVIESLQKQNAIQLILTTHSPNLASKLKLENLIICNNGNAFPMGADYTKLNPADYKFLEKFLDTTKANLFFAKGIILVEGWAEEILIPSISKNIGVNLTEKGISIVNVGSLAYNRYANIFLRKQGPFMSIPIAILTDSDIREYQKVLIAGEAVYQKRDLATIQAETDQKIIELKAKSENNVLYFIAPNWTLEYSLFKSNSLTSTLQINAKSIHTGTDWETDFEKSLAEKLINKGLKKTEIAYRIANAIDEDLKNFEEKKIDAKTINIATNDEEDSINYLVKAINYVTGN